MKRERTGRLIINIYDEINDDDALEYVSSVVDHGKVSADGASYCYGMTWSGSDLRVSTDAPRKRSPLTHTFYIYRQGGGAA